MLWARKLQREAYEPRDTLTSLAFGLGSTVDWYMTTVERQLGLTVHYERAGLLSWRDRTLTSHRFIGDGREMTYLEQLLDSTTIPGPPGLCTGLR